MKTEQFIQRFNLLPPAISDDEVKAMELFIEQYPWCGIARQLLLEALYQNHDERFSDYIPQTSMYVVHRDQLYYRLQQLAMPPTEQKLPAEDDDAILEIEEGIEVQEEEVKGERVQGERVQGERVQGEKVETEKIDEVDEKNKIDEIDEVVEQSPVTHHPSPVTRHSSPVTRHSSPAPGDYFAGEAIEIDEKTDPIARFIVERPQIRPIASSLMGIELPNQIEQSPPPKKFEDIVTETLAKIYESQGLVSLALVTYEKLSLLEPKKSAYFAAQIHNLKFKPKY